jgi:hypothetical protein
VLPVFAMFVVVSPLTADWGRTAWTAAGALVGLGVAAYLANVWRTSGVQLDNAGVSLHLPGGRQTWPYDKLLKVTQIGRYRVKMCFDPGIPDKHMHIKVDLVSSDRFVDALLDRYEIATGHELPLPEEAHAA